MAGDEDETPLTNKLLEVRFGFIPDWTGAPSLHSLHVDVDRGYACVRSFPIPCPPTVGRLRELCRVLGLFLREYATDAR